MRNRFVSFSLLEGLTPYRAAPLLIIFSFFPLFSPQFSAAQEQKPFSLVVKALAEAGPHPGPPCLWAAGCKPGRGRLFITPH